VEGVCDGCEISGAFDNSDLLFGLLDQEDVSSFLLVKHVIFEFFVVSFDLELVFGEGDTGIHFIVLGDGHAFFDVFFDFV